FRASATIGFTSVDVKTARPESPLQDFTETRQSDYRETARSVRIYFNAIESFRLGCACCRIYIRFAMPLLSVASPTTRMESASHRGCVDGDCNRCDSSRGGLLSSPHA